MSRELYVSGVSDESPQLAARILTRAAGGHGESTSIKLRSQVSKPSDFGAQLVTFRKLRGFSAAALADDLYIHRSHLSRIERGERRATPELAQRSDELLQAKGQLLAAWAASQGPAHPEQLPPPPPSPVQGRDTELRAIDAAMTSPDRPGLVAIDGPPNCGKTALMLHWAHAVRPRFPDGQLYTNLHTDGSNGPRPIPPEVVLERWLAALDTTVPDDLDRRAARYRSVLAHQRILVLLDDAADINHVEPLLPAGLGCGVVITSRSSLVALRIRYGATHLTLAPSPGA